MDAQTIQKLKAKIERLDRMTVANGCTEGEAQNATSMASRLRAQLPPEAPRRSQARAQQGVYNQQQTMADNALWRMFAQGLQGFGTPSHGNLYDAVREQSVLDDIDAFLGTDRNGKVRF